MKERTFYTINLDFRRIVFSVLILIGLMAYFFILGNSIGKKSVAVKENSSSTKDESKLSEKSPLKSSPEENMVPAPAEEKIDSSDSEVVDLKPSAPIDNTKPIPVPAPVVEVKEDLLKKTPTANPIQPATVTPVKTVPATNVATNTALPVKKPIY